MDPTNTHSSAGQDLQVRTRRSDSTLWIELCGEIDLSNHPRLTQSLRSVTLDESRTLGLDLAGLTFCDTRGLCYLLDMARQAHAEGRDVVARAATATIRKMTSMLDDKVVVRFE